MTKPFSRSLSLKKLYCLVGSIYSISFTLSGLFQYELKKRARVSLRLDEYFEIRQIYLCTYVSCAMPTLMLMIVVYGKMSYQLHVHNKQTKALTTKRKEANICLKFKSKARHVCSLLDQSSFTGAMVNLNTVRQVKLDWPREKYTCLPFD